MGDNGSKPTDKTAKVDAPSASFAEVQKQLDAVQLSQAAQDALNLRAITHPTRPDATVKSIVSAESGPAKPGSEAATPGAAAPASYEPNNGIVHLTGLAFTSTFKGLVEPAQGGLQIAEQLANAATTHIPGVGKAYFHPENLSPKEEAAPPPEKYKYSGEWFVKNIFENVGKLPWYYLTAKGMSRVPGFKQEASLLNETRMLGMSMKTSAASGFIVSSLNPTDVRRDPTLLGSLQERSLQGLIGAGQMAAMTGTTALTGKGFAMVEKRLVGGGEALTAEETLARTAELAKRTGLERGTSAVLKFTKNGSIASIGAIPAGLAAGYTNAKIHGTKFDAAENVVATMTLGFGLGGLGPGHQESAAAVPPGAAKVEARTGTAANSSAPEVAPAIASPAVPPESSTTARVTTKVGGVIRETVQSAKARAKAIISGGDAEHGMVFNGAGEIPESGKTGDGPKSPEKGPDVPPPKGPEKVETSSTGEPPLDKSKGKPEAKPAGDTGSPEAETGPDPAEAPAKPKRFRVNWETDEAKATYDDVYKRFIKAAVETGTKADEADFVKNAARDPWTISRLREHMSKQEVESEHVKNLLDRADRAAKDNAIVEEKVPANRAVRASFEKGYDLLRHVAEATKAKDLRAAQTALKEFIVNGDQSLPAKEQLRSAAKKIGGDELQQRFDKLVDNRYVVASRVHQLTGDHASFTGDPHRIVEVRATSVDKFVDIVRQAKVVAESHAGTSPEMTTPKGRTIEAKSSREQRYTLLRMSTENLDPDMKASLVDYANKSNDLRFRALINDILTDPKGENRPNSPIIMPHDPALEPTWDRMHDILATHPRPAAPGEAPTPAEVSAYREEVFNALGKLEKSAPAVLEMAKLYAKQTNNSFEASALDYYFGIDRLQSFKGVEDARKAAVETRDNRNEYIPKPATPPPFDIATGEMKLGNGYLEQLRERLGVKDAPKTRPWNGDQPVSSLLDQTDTKFTSRGVTRGKFQNDPNGLYKVITQPDTISGVRGGKHSTALYENNPEGIIQVDDYADGTRWTKQKPEGEPESRNAFFADGTNYVYMGDNAWSIDFPNGNYIDAYPEGPVAREISENGTVTQVMRDGTTQPKPAPEAPAPEVPPAEVHEGTAEGTPKEEGAPAENLNEAKPADVKPTVDELFGKMNDTSNELGRQKAAEALKSQIGSMSDAQFDQWLAYLRETPQEPNARPNYMTLNNLRGLGQFIESGMVDNAAVRQSLKTLLEGPKADDFQQPIPGRLKGMDPADMPPWLLNDMRSRFSTVESAPTPENPAATKTVYSKELPAELQDYFDNNKPFDIRSNAGAPESPAFRLGLVQELSQFKPETSAKLLQLGAQDPAALADVLDLMREPRNDIPPMRKLLSETIPNADSIYAMKVLLESVDNARQAFKNPDARALNENLALRVLAEVTGDKAHDQAVANLVSDIIYTRSDVNKGSVSRLGENLSLAKRTKPGGEPPAPPEPLIPPEPLRPAEPLTPPETQGEAPPQAKSDPPTGDQQLTPDPLKPGTSETAGDNHAQTEEPTRIPADGAPDLTTVQPPLRSAGAQPGPEGQLEGQGPGTRVEQPAETHEKPAPEKEKPAEAPPPPPKTVDDLVGEMQNGENERVRLAAARSLRSQLATMNESQFHEWMKFLGEESSERPIRPNYMKLPNMRNFGDIFDSGILKNPEAEKALQSYLQAPAPGEFKLAYPKVMQDMTVSEMPKWLRNDVRDRFSAERGRSFQADVPPEVQDYVKTQKREDARDTRNKRLPDLGPDTLETRLAVLPELSKFTPDTAARLLELGANDPRALADVVRIIKEDRNDIPQMKNLLAETLPNADDIYTVKVMLEALDTARGSFKPEAAAARAENKNVALRALSYLTNDKAQDVRLAREINQIIQTRFWRNDMPESHLAETLNLGRRTMGDPPAAPGQSPAQPPKPEVQQPAQPPEPPKAAETTSQPPARNNRGNGGGNRGGGGGGGSQLEKFQRRYGGQSDDDADGATSGKEAKGDKWQKKQKGRNKDRRRNGYDEGDDD